MHENLPLSLGKMGLGHTCLSPKPLAHSRSLVRFERLVLVVSPASEHSGDSNTSIRIIVGAPICPHPHKWPFILFQMLITSWNCVMNGFLSLVLLCLTLPLEWPLHTPRAR